jgi:UDP-N-acetylmuramoyl-tripeptide--D-alanyl-D-alanine ligase
VAVITAIGPVHLERFGSLDRVLSAKAEIMRRARCGVLVEDNPRLAALADELAARRPGAASDATPGAPVVAPIKVIRVSATRPSAEVCVLEDAQGLSVLVRGAPVARTAPGEARPGNVAAAVAVALELGVPAAEVAQRLATLPVAPHRLEPSTDGRGVVVLDDTYNANPAGAAVALQTLTRHGARARRRVVVTPGMVELGPLQADENARFAESAGNVATDLVVVGRTNHAALLRGVAAARATRRGGGDKERDGAGDNGEDTPRVTTVRTREEATAWVRANVERGDVVLYENDLPDHYP